MRSTRRARDLSELTGAAAPGGRFTAQALRVPRQPVRILGLDPGSRITGYAFLVTAATGPHGYVASGCIRTASGSFPGRLGEIYAGVAALIEEYAPDEVAIERVFVHRNADSALKLGQARGAAISATFARRLRVYEYAPREIKLAVVGAGGAQKEQVQLMVRQLLRVSGRLRADAADALAVALCHAHCRESAADDS